MRYTTIIDLSEYASLYRNHNVRLVYLHMVLRSGWHDEDRDILDMSIRALAQGAGLSISSVRHALRQLEKSHLIVRQGNVWSVRKWVLQETPTPRPKSARKKVEQDVAQLRTMEQEQRDQERARERAYHEQLASQGKTTFMLYYEDLLKQAEQGDVEAQQAVRRHRAAYEEQRATMEARIKNKIK